MPRDPEYAICPHCRYEMGDCWEWLKSEHPMFYDCDNCGKSYRAWAEYDVTYVTDFPQESKTDDQD